MQIKEVEKTNWSIIAILYLVGIGAAVQFAKVPPILDQLIEHYVISLSTAGFLISSVGMMGLVLGIASVSFIKQFGFRNLLLIFVLIGAFTAFSESLLPEFSSMVMLRILEGSSHLVIVVAAPTLMLRFSRPQDTSVVMGIWGSFFGLGFVLSNAFSPWITETLGWQSIFAVHGIFLLVLFFLLYAALPQEIREERKSLQELMQELKRVHLETWKNKPIMSLGMVFLWHTFMFVSILTFFNALILQEYKLDKAFASNWIALSSFVSILGTIGAGIFIRLFNRPFLQLIVSFTVILLTTVSLFSLSVDTSIGLVISLVLFLCGGVIQGSVFALIPLVTVDSDQVLIANGAIAQLGKAYFLRSHYQILLVNRVLHVISLSLPFHPQMKISAKGLFWSDLGIETSQASVIH
ncbi:MAG: hypothetical protein COB67_13555 [SAR324 cluster bacterium]|uniref:Major facilitator superfamily (MFS) profile domain-containing protein n=1 Tax=SAR324 cluster bacterium TaxID=2024889 RepID=A0A2A4SMB0_9DELT|nr:MAG: hypothetical protein COB67_13555 [SAR324 cluster bacterium]